MKKSITAVLAGVAFSMFISAAAAAPVLQLRLAADEQSEGTEKMTYTTQPDDHGVVNVLYVQKEVLLDETMLKSANAVTDALGHNNILLTFNEVGTKKFADV